LRTYGRVAVYNYTVTVDAEQFATGNGVTTSFPLTVTVNPSNVAPTSTGSQWVEIDTDANGYNDNVYLTTLGQCLNLNLGESPFFANYGIPQQQTIVTQVFPDYYMMQTQTQFAPFFASLIITRAPNANPPTYNVTALTHSGAVINKAIAI
jgi:hypothetical protein